MKHKTTNVITCQILWKILCVCEGGCDFRDLSKFNYACFIHLLVFFPLLNKLNKHRDRIFLSSLFWYLGNNYGLDLDQLLILCTIQQVYILSHL